MPVDGSVVPVEGSADAAGEAAALTCAWAPLKRALALSASPGAAAAAAAPAINRKPAIGNQIRRFM